MNTICFPGFGLEFNINPIAFSILSKDVRWYALILTSGLLLGALFVLLNAPKNGVSQDAILDIVLFGTPTAIVFARAYYVICEWDYYSAHKDEIVKIWNGGIAIYGAIIGAVFAAFLYCRLKKLDVGKIFDECSFGLLIGQIVGRWGNFVNAEAYGGETTLPWRMYIAEIGKAVHPTFLYESLWNLMGFALLLIYKKHKKFNGEIFLMYIAWYGFGRFFIESLRTDSLYIPNTGIRTSQLLAAVSVFASIGIILYKRHKNKR